MFAYISRRLGALLVTLLGSSFILYNLAAISGDPLQELRVSTDPNAQQRIIALTRTLQLDVPPPLRYFLWLKGVLGGFIGQADFGLTRDSQPVTTTIAAVIPTTVRLVFFATLIAIILGIAVGIATALRQYSRFDYAMTFVSFLLFSLPIFWIAVLLKQYLAIEFNNFLSDPNIPITWAVIASLVTGVFWSGIIGGDRKRVGLIFAVAAIGNFILLLALDALKWFTEPFLGPILIFALGIGVAYGVTLLSTGLGNKATLKAAQMMAVFALITYYPVQKAFEWGHHTLVLIGLEVFTLTLAFFTARYFAKIDRGPAIRTTMITAFIISLLVFLDKLMQTWRPYMETDAINYRPIPTTGQVNALLDPTQWWFTTLDVLVHMILPTIALTLISFAGYIRYSRGTLLEVLNQDYIRTARAKGLTERTVIMRHAFRNTLIPLTTIMVVDFAGILGGAAITERVFGWIGMGTISLQAISAFDLNLLMGTSLILGFLSVFANLVADLLYSALDPRIRAGKGA